MRYLGEAIWEASGNKVWSPKEKWSLEIYVYWGNSGQRAKNLMVEYVKWEMKKTKAESALEGQQKKRSAQGVRRKKE